MPKLESTNILSKFLVAGIKIHSMLFLLFIYYKISINKVRGKMGCPWLFFFLVAAALKKTTMSFRKEIYT